MYRRPVDRLQLRGSHTFQQLNSENADGETAQHAGTKQALNRAETAKSAADRSRCSIPCLNRPLPFSY